MKSIKYPKTYHLSASPGVAVDKEARPMFVMYNTNMVITEKLDGSNVGISREMLSSRSGETPADASFDSLKALYASMQWTLPDDLIFFAEWCEAVHTFRYPWMNRDSALDRLFVFAAYEKESGEFLPWEETEFISSAMGFQTVPVIGFRKAGDLDKDDLNRLLGEPSLFGSEREGVVVRNTQAFNIQDFSFNVVKFSKDFNKGEAFGNPYEPQGVKHNCSMV